jgi:hypothetical protein
MESDGSAGVKKPFWQKLLGSDNPNPVRVPHPLTPPPLDLSCSGLL